MMTQHDEPNPAGKGPSEAFLPWWKRDGLLLAGGWHPLAARIRQGLRLDDEEELYSWEYSAAHMDRLKDLGVTLLLGQFDRGLSDADQSEEQERARWQAAEAHSRGFHHGCYIANTVYYESVLKESPECEDWVIRTFDGRRVFYGGQQTWRWVACFNSPGWRARIKRQIRKAIEHVGTDLLHLDNLTVWPEPDSCHCTHCTLAFRAYLTERFPTAEEQRRAFGFAGLGGVTPPPFYLRFQEPWELDRITNPLLLAWIDFRCHTVHQYLREMCAQARGLKPDICISINGAGIWGVNQAFVHGVKHCALWPLADIIWDENPDATGPALSPRELASSDAELSPLFRLIRTKNAASRAGKSTVSQVANEEELALNIAASGDAGINIRWGYSEPKKMPLTSMPAGFNTLLHYYQTHTSLFNRCRPAARIAVWHNHESFGYTTFGSRLSATVIEQLLLNRHIPFSIVFDDALTDEGLRDYDLLIAPNVEFVSDEKIRLLTKYVADGGNLLITEQFGTYNQHWRRRSTAALTTLLDSVEATEPAASDGSGKIIRLGRGAVGLMPDIAYSVRPILRQGHNYNGRYNGVDMRYWHEPKNSADILGLIAQLYPAYSPFTIESDSPVFTDLREWDGGRIGAVIVRLGDIEPVDTVFHVSGASAPKDPLSFQPDLDTPLPLNFESEGPGWRAILPNLGRIAIISWQAAESRPGNHNRLVR